MATYQLSYTGAQVNSILGEVAGKQSTANLTTTLSASSTDTQYPSAKVVYDSQTTQDTEIEAIEDVLPLATEEDDAQISIDNAKAYKMMGETIVGKHQQDTTKITYKCDGTETGTYYLTYNSINYQFTMPTVTSDSVLVFDTSTLKLYLGSTEITTSTGTSGTQLTFVVSPNPDYPQTITQVSSATLKRCGKNLCDIGVFTADQTYTSISWGKKTSSKIFVKEGQTYRVSWYVNGTRSQGTNTYGYAYVYAFDKNDTKIGGDWLSSAHTSTKTVDTGSGIAYLRVLYGVKGEIGTTFVAQLEESSSITDYEAYQGQSISVDLDGNTLNAVSSTVHDNLLIDKKGNVAIERNVGKIVLDGSEDGWYVYSKAFSSENIGLNNGQYSICSHFVDAGAMWNSESEIYRGKYTITNNYNMFKCMPLTTMSLAYFKTWLASNPVTLYYQLATPTTITLPALSTLPTTLDGINHIWVETNIGSTNIEVKYVEDLQKAIEDLQQSLVALGGV